MQREKRGEMRFDFEKLEISLRKMCLAKAKINQH